MKRNALLLVAGALAFGLIAAGCGGNDDESSSTGTESSTTALTKAEFLQKGNAICKAGNQEINQAFNQIQGNPTQAQAEQIVTDSIVPSVQGQIDDIRALGAPAGDEDQVNQILDDAQAANDKTKADPSLAIQENSDPFAKANQEATAYGLTECGSSD